MLKVKRTLSIFCNDPILGFYLFNCFVYYLIIWCVIFIDYLDFMNDNGLWLDQRFQVVYIIMSSVGTPMIVF